MKRIDCPSCGIEISDLPLKLQKRKLLLVEGRDEEEFFGGLLRYLAIDDIQVIPVGGKHQFADKLQGLIKDADFPEIVSMGIVRDADDDPKATFQSICDALKQAHMPVPKKVTTKAARKGFPEVIVMILPDANERGALEDICLAAVNDDKANTCVAQYFSCLKEQGVSGPKPKGLNKSRVRVFLSSKEDPTLSLGIAAQRGYWPFDHKVFADVKTFLKSL